jgi:hypothetical protein
MQQFAVLIEANKEMQVSLAALYAKKAQGTTH